MPLPLDEDAWNVIQSSSTAASVIMLLLLLLMMMNTLARRLGLCQCRLSSRDIGIEFIIREDENISQCRKAER